MSADNQTCVLTTLGSNGKPEYRIAVAQAVENIFQPLPIFDEGKYIGNIEDLEPQSTRTIFGESEVLRNRDEAFKRANALEADNPTEYGVGELNFVHIPFPKAEG